MAHSDKCSNREIGPANGRQDGTGAGTAAQAELEAGQGRASSGVDRKFFLLLYPRRYLIADKQRLPDSMTALLGESSRKRKFLPDPHRATTGTASLRGLKG